MESTGIIRRVDDLGRIVLPKEARKKAGIREGTPMEIFTTADGVVLKKYFSEEVPLEAVNLLDTAIDNAEDLEWEKVCAIREHIGGIKKLLKSQEE